ncbi:MAG: hypothetical protein KDB22_06900 [Planctomycetales bacterium]|nr:hypothetical protein [Planctomycetales bacterium]
MKRLDLGRQFGLRTLLVLIAIAAWGSLQLNVYLRTRPPTQEAYSAADLQQHLNQGRVVMVTVDADWALNPTARPRFMSAEVSRQIRARGIATMTADWTRRSPSVDQLMRSIDRNMIPALAVYSPRDPLNPIILPGDASDSLIVATLESL